MNLRLSLLVFCVVALILKFLGISGYSFVSHVTEV